MFKNLLLVICLSFCATTWLAAQLNVNFVGGTANSNETIDVDVTVSNFNEIVSVQFSINWDPNVAAFVSVENITDVLPSFTQDANIGISEGALDIDPGELTVSWSLPSTEPVTIPDNTRLFTIRLRAVGSACANTDLTITNTPRSIEVTDNDLNDIGLTAGAASVMVAGENCDGVDPGDGLCDNSPNFSLITSNTTIPPSGNVCIPITTRNFDNISGITVGWSWNPAILTYTGSRNGAINQLLFNEEEASSGILGLQWLTFSGGVDVADGETIFELCFDVNGSIGQSTELTFGQFGINVGVEVINGNEEELEVCLDSSTITIGEGDVAPEDCATTDNYALIIENQSSEMGNNVCFPVLVRNHNNIVALKTSFAWDASVLSFTGLQNGALSGFTTNDANVSSGELVILWDSAFDSNVADGSAIMDICFDVVGSAGARSNIEIGTATNNDIISSDNLNVNLDACFQTGVFTVLQGEIVQPPEDDICLGTSDVSIEIKNAEVFRNETICVPVTSQNFRDIVKLQTSFNWDASKLRYSSINEVNLQDIQLNSGLANNGELQLIWNASSEFEGLTINDNAVLFELCFEAIGSFDDFTDIEIGTSETFSTEVLLEGIMSTNDGPPDPVQDGACANSTETSFVITNVNAAPSSNICIPITTRNFDDVTSFLFSFSWDPEKLSYTGNNAGMLQGVVINNQDNLLEKGEINVLWFTGTGFGFNFDDDVTLFELCFDVLNSDIEDIDLMVGERGVTPSVTVGENSDEVDFCFDNGVILVRDGSGGGGDTPPRALSTCLDNGRITIREFIPPPTLAITLEAGTGTVEKDEEICIEISVENFEDIQSMQFNLTWDASVLRYERFNNPMVLNGFGMSNVNLNDNNLLTISWNPFTPQTLDGKTVIFEACFTAIGDCVNPESTDLRFVDGGGIDIEITNQDNETLEVIDRAGSVSIEMCDDVVEPNPVTFSSVVVTNVSCTGANDGSISGIPGGGEGVYTCRWSDPVNVFQTTNTNNSDVCGVSGLAPGNYSLLITNNNSINFTRDFTITEPDPLELRVNRLQDQSCSARGEISLSTEGGTGPYSYQWSQGLSNKEDHIDLLAGEYCLTLTDANDCALQRCFNIQTDIAALDVRLQDIQPVSCSTESDGSIRIQVEGGCSPYNYQWTSVSGFSSTDQNIFGLRAGVYTVSVTDSSNSQPVWSTSYTVPEGGDLNVAANIGDVTVIEGNNGSINIDVTGENTTGLVYNWSDGSMESDRNGLAPGEYGLTVTQEGSGCSYTRTFEVQWAAIFADNIDFDGTGVVCPEGSTAIIDGFIVGGCGGNEIRINGILVESLPIADLSVGEYEIVLQDSCGNQSSKTFSVTNFEAINIAAQNVQCSSNLDDGSFELDIEGGSGQFDIDWPPPGIISDSLTLSGLPAGTYEVLVTDLLCEGQEMRVTVDIATCDGGGGSSPTDCSATPILTPNGDGLNETFKIDCLENGANQPSNLSVYDRWGRLVFGAANYDNSWAGTDESGNQLNPGGYMWVLEIENANGFLSINRGTLTILSDNF